jgi:hypothetical protein
MMRPATALLSAATALAGCAPSAEQLQQMPAHFTVTVPGYWDRVAICLTDAYSSGLLVPDNRAVPAEKRAELYLQIRGSLGQQLNVALFDIRGDGRNSAVSFHRRATLLNWEETLKEARDRVESCANAK